MQSHPLQRDSGRRGLAAGALLLCALASAPAQAPLAVYADYLVNGFQDWGWATRNYASTSPVHSGNSSVAVTITSGYQGLQIYHSDLNSSPYSSISRRFSLRAQCGVWPPAPFPAPAEWKSGTGSLCADALGADQSTLRLPILCLSSPEPHRSLTVAPLQTLQRCDGETTVRLRRG